MLNRLAQAKEGCFNALSGCAYEYGLLLDEPQAEQKTCLDSCQALQAARGIAESVLENRSYPKSSEKLQNKVEEVMAGVAHCVRNCNSQFTDREHCGEEEAGITSCRLLAPLVMDCLLQQLQPYI
jgi:hypothetical protein